MLVLSRKINESVVIDDIITIKIISVKGDKVKLGFEAPDDVNIRRAELAERIAAELALDATEN